MLYPDAGCYEKWKAKLKKISSDVHCTMEISDVVENHATEQQLEYGYDFADYVIDKIREEKKQPSTALQKMMDKNPSLTGLIEKFGLEEI